MRLSELSYSILLFYYHLILYFLKEEKKVVETSLSHSHQGLLGMPPPLWAQGRLTTAPLVVKVSHVTGSGQ